MSSSVDRSIHLLDLPIEVQLHILTFLDIPDLLACSRTSRALRELSITPYIHRLRLRSTRVRLSTHLPHRPPLSALTPPHSSIYLSNTQLAARLLSRLLVTSSLSRRLSRRPNVGQVVALGILPQECCRWDERAGEWVPGEGRVSGGLVGIRRRLEFESRKDGLRGWLNGGVFERRRREVEELEERRERERRGIVRRLARRFTVVSKDGKAWEGRWGRETKGTITVGGGAEGACKEPTRAHVLGLRRYWEGIITGRGNSA